MGERMNAVLLLGLGILTFQVAQGTLLFQDHAYNGGIISGTVYYSFLLKVNATTGLSETGESISGLLRNGSASSYNADVMLRMNGATVEIGSIPTTQQET